jgi:hypothetical protein
MIDKPDPLVPADVDLRDFGYMPLDALRLRDSELAIEASPEVFRASVLLWCASWHQVPAGSLPNKDKTLADYCRAGVRWPRIRADVLSRWVQCSDGRLYHPVVAEKAREAQTAKDAQRNRTKGATAAREAKRVAAEQAARDEEAAALCHGQRDVQRDEERDVQRDVVQGKVREGKVRERIEKKKPSASSAGPTIPCPYDEIVALYHEALPSLPKVKLMPADRQRALRKVWGWVLSSTKSDGGRRATTSVQALEWIAGYFRRAAENDFLMGRTQRTHEHAGWK